MKRLLSHPTLYLRKHIRQVQTAMAAILSRHHHNIRTDGRNITAICATLAQLHDTGKASIAFQEYIKDPDSYRGDKLVKSHTPLSMILTVAKAMKEDWEPLYALALAQVANGHHAGLATRREMDERLYSDDIASVLEAQLSTLDLTGLETETGLKFTDITLDDSPWLRAANFIDECWEQVDALTTAEAIAYRLYVQLLFSILLEADKAFLAVPNPERYIGHKPVNFLPVLVDVFVKDQDDTPINTLRQEARLGVLSNIAINPDCKIATVTLPTGLGKTATAASWALTLREHLGTDGFLPKIIIVLPFLSIIDQTEAVYRRLLNIGKGQGEVLLPCHSLADRVYDPEMEGNIADFFIDTWRSEVIITTFDQFLLALMDKKARYQMRFHNLYDSLIIIDEVQTLPCKLWDPLDHIFKALVEEGNSRILAMSATLPGFLSSATELVSGYRHYFKKFGRYRLLLRHPKTQTLDDFAASLCRRLPAWTKEGRRVLITLNTRKSARTVRDRIEDAGAEPIYFLSADVTPSDRMATIKAIRENKPCIVVSTQCVEAGVDIDLDLVIRDFAPLDSIIQVAGRCNRNFKKSRCDVEVVAITDSSGRLFCDVMGYDPIHLQETRKVFAGTEEIVEEEIIDICSEYFSALATKKDTGSGLTESFARWKDMPPVRELLRGKDQEQYHLLVIEKDPELKKELESVIKNKERWQRRRSLRALAGRIAQITVSVYAKRGFNLEDIAERCGNEWLLHEGFYSSERGLELPPILSGGTLIL